MSDSQCICWEQDIIVWQAFVTYKTGRCRDAILGVRA